MGTTGIRAARFSALLIVGFHLLGAISASPAGNWITAPQVCRGKPYSDTARQAKWKFDPEQKVSTATPDSATMSTDVFPGHNADYVVNVRMRLSDDAQCRLRLGNTTFDVRNLVTHTLLTTGGVERSVNNNSDDARIWTLLTIRRRSSQTAVYINGEYVTDSGSSTQAVKTIGLQATAGTIAVSNFVLTGNLQRRNPTE